MVSFARRVTDVAVSDESAANGCVPSSNTSSEGVTSTATIAHTTATAMKEPAYLIRLILLVLYCLAFLSITAVCSLDVLIDETISFKSGFERLPCTIGKIFDLPNAFGEDLCRLGVAHFFKINQMEDVSVVVVHGLHSAV